MGYTHSGATAETGLWATHSGATTETELLQRTVLPSLALVWLWSAVEAGRAASEPALGLGSPSRALGL